MKERVRESFYDIQRRQRAKSILLFALLILFYIFAIGLLAFSLLAGLGLWLGGPGLWTAAFQTRFWSVIILAAVFIAFFHFRDARKFGAEFILRRLGAKPPDFQDRYHKQFADTVEEIRIAAGLPRVNSFVLSSFGINSMALVEPDGTPAVAVTEGLLADCTRDEMQAVAAHELAHVLQGDAYFVTLVCSLANFFEKIRDALEPDVTDEANAPGSRCKAMVGPALMYLTAAGCSLVMNFLGMFLSRQREIRADAVAVELSRSPISLARAIYKAGIKNSMIGDFSQSYSPLFIVPPRLGGEDEGFFGRLSRSHPPTMIRISLLAHMASTEPAKIIEQVWETQRNREKARGVLPSFDELKISLPFSTGAPVSLPDTAGTQSAAGRGKDWQIRDKAGVWQGPFTLEELTNLPYFAGFSRVANLPEKIEATAREFPQVRLALHRQGRSKPSDAARLNRCPRCRVPLSETFYEGVRIKACPCCRGKLVDAGLMERIIARKEVTFSEDLVSKGRQFKEKFLLNPIKAQRQKDNDAPALLCPDCGYRLAGRPYNYQYFVPVDKCLSCQKIWFDADELEILQIIIEKL